MDNNNSLPYGAISSTNDNIPLHQNHFVPTGPASARNDIQGFNPLLLARNVHLQQPAIQEQISSAPTRHLNPSTRNNPYRISSLHYNSNISHEQNMDSSSSSLSGSDNSLIIYNNIPYGNNSGLTISHQLNDARTVNVPGNRYFTPLWPVTHTDNTRVNTLTSLDGATGRGGTAPLPIIREEMTPSALNTSFECIKSKRPLGLKRRVSRDDEADDGLPRPATKLLLTEEKMAAKMLNLRISNDHCYHLNGLPPQLNVPGINGRIDCDILSPVAKSNDNKDSEEHKEDDNNNMESGDSTMFVLAPGIKEVLSKTNQLLPQSIIDQMSKPCLAVIPWKPHNDVLTKISLHANQNKTDDEKSAQKKINFFENKGINDTSQQPTAFVASGIHTEAMDDFIVPFDFEEDDMDL